MLLVYKNVEMFCQKNGISLHDLFSILNIDNDKYYSTSRSKSVSSAKEQIFQQIADYFHVDKDELTDRFYDEPEIIWTMRSNPEKFYNELLDIFSTQMYCWEKLDIESAKTFLHTRLYPSPREHMCRYMAFQIRFKDYIVYLYGFTLYTLPVDMYRAVIHQKEMSVYAPCMVIKSIGIDEECFGVPADYGDIKRRMWTKLLERYDIVNKRYWYFNHDYKIYIQPDYNHEDVIFDLDAGCDVMKNYNQSTSQLLTTLHNKKHISDHDIQTFMFYIDDFKSKILYDIDWYNSQSEDEI